MRWCGHGTLKCRSATTRAVKENRTRGYYQTGPNAASRSDPLTAVVEDCVTDRQRVAKVASRGSACWAADVGCGSVLSELVKLFRSVFSPCRGAYGLVNAVPIVHLAVYARWTGRVAFDLCLVVGFGPLKRTEERTFRARQNEHASDTRVLPEPPRRRCCVAMARGLRVSGRGRWRR